ncbi:hypothetical protein [Syntrophorhabdus aromaticivorans]|jgi:hypothetical protein|nr:hypothetical protein [Syntrophorhabdus aromaticivorans]
MAIRANVKKSDTIRKTGDYAVAGYVGVLTRVALDIIFSMDF